MPATRSWMLVPLVLLPAAASAFVTQNNNWNSSDGPVEYYVSARGSDDILDDGEVGAVDRAFRTWECVPCSTIQFRNMGVGPNNVDQDGKNTVIWVETPQLFQQLLGSSPDGVLATTVNYDPDAKPYFEQDVVFNGTTFQGKRIIWSTDPQPVTDPDAGVVELDVETVMLQQAGFFLGLAYNCNPPGSQTCAGTGTTVMTPSYGGVLRTLRQDDKDGVCSIYPGTKTSCDKRRLKESCEKDCDCDDGLVCVPDGDGRMCSKRCNASDGLCPNHTGCVLTPQEGGATGTGLCIRRADGNLKIDGMTCIRDSECVSGACELARSIGRQVCKKSCATETDCGVGYTCTDRACILSATGDTVPCPSTDPPPSDPPKEDPKTGTGCGHSNAPGGLPLSMLALLGVAAWMRRRG